LTNEKKTKRSRRRATCMTRPAAQGFAIVALIGPLPVLAGQAPKGNAWGQSL
jgi:uncharacterized membrane protein